ncbi:hypothetical protein P153DRAFT_282607, partial [Dothidotthia symphoricarpi CBS 119687]
MTKIVASSQTTDSYTLECLADVLEEAAEEGNLPLVEAAIEMGADVQYRSNRTIGKKRHHALEKAAFKGHAPVVDYLLRRGAINNDVLRRVRTKDLRRWKYTHVDLMLLDAIYAGHVELAICLLSAHGAYPETEECSIDGYSATRSVIHGVSEMKSIDRGMRILEVILRNTAFKPSRTTVDYSPDHRYLPHSALSRFVQAGWVDAVEMMLSIEDLTTNYKCGRAVYPLNALSVATWEKRPQDSLRILKLLIDRKFDLNFAQNLPGDGKAETALGRATRAGVAEGVALILQRKPALLKETFTYSQALTFEDDNDNFKTLSISLLSVAIIDGSTETAKVLLHNGAHPRDAAFQV